MKIGNFEKKIIECLQNRIDILFVLFVSIDGLLIRYSLRNIMTSDMNCYIRWIDEMRSYGGFSGLAHKVGGYSALYQFLYAILSYLPFNTLYMLKTIFVIFDYVLAVGVYKLTYEISSGNVLSKKKKSAMAYAIVILSPIVFMNSSAWGQCDAMYVSCLIYSLLFLVKEKYRTSFIIYGLAISLKLQAIIVLPLFIFLLYI